MNVSVELEPVQDMIEVKVHPPGKYQPITKKYFIFRPIRVKYFEIVKYIVSLNKCFYIET